MREFTPEQLALFEKFALLDKIELHQMLFGDGGPSPKGVIAATSEVAQDPPSRQVRRHAERLAGKGRKL